MDFSHIAAALAGAGLVGIGIAAFYFVRRRYAHPTPPPPAVGITELVQHITRAIPDAVIVIRADGTILYASASFYSLFQILPEKGLIGSNLLDWVHADDRVRMAMDIDGFKIGNATVENRYKLLRTDGGDFTGEITASFIANHDPAQAKILAVIRDVTRRMILEEKLRESEERFRKIVETIPFPVMLSRKSDSTLLYVNQRAVELFGETILQAVGSKTYDFYFNPAQRALLLEELLATGRVRDRELHLVLPDGRSVWGLVSVQPTFFGQEEVLLSSLNDVTQYKQTGAALQAGEERYRRLTENMTDMVNQITPSGHFVYSSPSCTSILGFSVEYLEGMTIYDLVHPADLASLVDRFRWLMEGGSLNRLELRCRTAQGGYLWLEVTGSVLRDEQGAINGAILSSRDISHRKAAEFAETEQRRLADALRDTAALVNSSLDLQEVLDRTLKNLERVVPHQSANIFLVDSAGTISMVARSGEHENERQSYEPAIGANYRKIVGLRMMAEKSRPLIVEDTREYSGWGALSCSDGRILSYLGAPILSKGRILGFLNLDSPVANYFTPEQAENLQVFANQVGTAIENARLYTEIQSLAVTDELTHIHNRRGFFDLGQREVERALRFQRPLSAMMLDIDYFKHFNDHYGYTTGDEVLVIVAQRCRGIIRDVDLLGRYGGEEFMVLLVENDLESAYHIAERLRLAVAQSPFETSRGQLLVTISLGVAQMVQPIHDVRALVDNASMALQLAKRNGRNCVRVYRPEE